MKKGLLSIAAALLSTFAIAQPLALVGIGKTNGTNSYNTVVKWDALSGNVATTVATPMYGVTLGSSCYDSYNSRYIVRGLDTTGSQVMMQSFVSAGFNNCNASPIRINGGAEYDMATGKMYTYDVVNSQAVMIEYDPATNVYTTLGTFQIVATGFMPDATCFNSNTHTYHFITNQGTNQYSLISVPVQASTFTYTVHPMSGITVTTNMGLEFDQTNDSIYMIYSNRVGSTNYMEMSTVDANTGTITFYDRIGKSLGYEFYNRTYDQTTHSMLFMAYDSTNTRKLWIYNVPNQSLSYGMMSDGYQTIEFEADNTQFANLRYRANATKQLSSSLNLYPNPATDQVTLQHSTSYSFARIIDLQGKTVKTFQLNGTQSTVSTADLAPGMYSVLSEFGAMKLMVK